MRGLHYFGERVLKTAKDAHLAIVLMEELINEPIHIREDGCQSCIDLISHIFLRKPLCYHPKILIQT